MLLLRAVNSDTNRYPPDFFGKLIFTGTDFSEWGAILISNDFSDTVFPVSAIIFRITLPFFSSDVSLIPKRFMLYSFPGSNNFGFLR